MDKKILDKFDYAPENPIISQNKGNNSRVYFEQLLCLLLLGGIAYHNSGLRVVAMAGFSLGGAVLMDIIGCAMSKKIYNPRDLSTLTAGLCVALLMPAGLDYRLVFFGSALTIGIRHVFGGKNNYIFNPTAAAFVFLILCYPRVMLLFPKPLEHLPIRGEINPALLSVLTPPESASTGDILLGNTAGAMGTVHILVILVTGFCLMLRRSVSPTVTISALTANILLSLIAGSFAETSGLFRTGLVVMMSGYFLFMLIFLANDPQTLPDTFLGKVYYGVFFGSVVVFFRRFGSVEGYPAFALLFVNTLSKSSDEAANFTIVNVRRAFLFARGRLNSYERIMEEAENIDEERESAIIESLISEQEKEIKINRHDYNMPPVDNKIIKINRKKPGLITRIKEKAGSLSEKRKLSQTDAPETSDINFLENLRDGVKELGGAFKKKDVPVAVSTESGEEVKAEEVPIVQMPIPLDNDDVIVIVPDESEESDEAEESKQSEQENLVKKV
ncbi:MAG: RnfABCDGE type electron transport complex subunit D [Oscillospiraceae bacterium]|nr:RnfABCDGE type electron transport complex subunit D [Oscillospiraceae bacterium]